MKLLLIETTEVKDSPKTTEEVNAIEKEKKRIKQSCPIHRLGH